ncbi:pyridoxal-phosphate dependent enzyme [Lentzea jiangxiensis]|uniref:Threonine dehydratase n=1 Tax=Lentzea jiangxiensis TaxID=641025 RepID=A0A1H0J1Z1_9PSEU|nr:pyridoxal-phosphate dependent enzyme [Lentzea jiangxiensis]SDO37754.1 threonine dehydratase [Lentzea jiangxiensis]
MAELLTVDDVRAAAEAIDGRVLRTPTLPSPGLSALLGVPTTVKLELLQRSGSFKARGAFAKILSLSDEARAAGVVGVSGGNHGIALADVAGELGVAATVVMPSSAPARSVELARAAGADVRLTDGLAAAFGLLRELVEAGATLVHPYDDPVVAAAQGTVGLEFAQDAPDVTDVLVSIGGGGLAAGVATAFRALVPGVRVWGVETEGADAMRQALDAGGPVEITPTSVVSTLSAPHVSQLTYDHAVALLEDVLTVSDAQAARGSIALAERQKAWAEPAAGCLVPAARTVLDRVGGGARLGIVVCGGNAAVADVMRWANA